MPLRLKLFYGLIKQCEIIKQKYILQSFSTNHNATINIATVVRHPQDGIRRGKRKYSAVFLQVSSVSYDYQTASG